MGFRSTVAAFVESAPADAQAIAFEDTWWTWGQIREVAERLTPLLDAAGLGEGARIGVLLRNRPQHMAVAISVLAAGRTVTTLSPLQPKDRLIADIERAAAPVVVGESALVDDPDIRAAIEVSGFALTLNEHGAIGGEPTRRDWPESAFSPKTTMEIPTSGTTGPPKRVKLLDSQFDGAFEGNGAVADGVPRLRSGVTIVNAPLVHIGGLWTAINTLCQGRKLVLLDRFKVDDWVRAVQRHSPRVASVVPAGLRALLDADLPKDALGSLEAVSSGTAPCPPELADAFYEHFGIPVLTTYGATEFAGPVALWSLKDWKEWGAKKRGSAGRPFGGIRMRASDPETGEPLPAGETGRLQLSGAQVAPNGGWVSTSDLGRVDEDGFVFITGRADDAINRGGFKVHKGAIQKALETHPAVRTASVVAKPDPRLGEVPVAAVELEPGATLTVEELEAHARSQLVPYEVPAEFRIVDELPRTSSLKVSAVDVLAMFTSADATA